MGVGLMCCKPPTKCTQGLLLWWLMTSGLLGSCFDLGSLLCGRWAGFLFLAACGVHSTALDLLWWTCWLPVAVMLWTVSEKNPAPPSPLVQPQAAKAKKQALPFLRAHQQLAQSPTVVVTLAQTVLQSKRACQEQELQQQGKPQCHQSEQPHNLHVEKQYQEATLW